VQQCINLANVITPHQSHTSLFPTSPPVHCQHCSLLYSHSASKTTNWYYSPWIDLSFKKWLKISYSRWPHWVPLLSAQNMKKQLHGPVLPGVNGTGWWRWCNDSGNVFEERFHATMNSGCSWSTGGVQPSSRWVYLINCSLSIYRLHIPGLERGGRDSPA
jgi:hypothetical protein